MAKEKPEGMGIDSSELPRSVVLLLLRQRRIEIECLKARIAKLNQADIFGADSFILDVSAGDPEHAAVYRAVNRVNRVNGEGGEERIVVEDRSHEKPGRVRLTLTPWGSYASVEMYVDAKLFFTALGEELDRQKT